MRTMREQLIAKGIVVRLSVKEEVADTKRSKKPKEQLSHRELQELMGSNRETFKREIGRAHV